MGRQSDLDENLMPPWLPFDSIDPKAVKVGPWYTPTLNEQ